MCERKNDELTGKALTPVVYDELRRLARMHMARLQPGQTMQPTALVHEAYLKLARTADFVWNDKEHFVAAAARAMRFILVDEARRKASAKHGGHLERVFIDDVVQEESDPLDLLVLDEVVTRLEQEDPHMGEFLNLRLFGSLTLAETAVMTGVSLDRAKREWRFIKRWLCAQMLERRPQTDGDGKE